MKPRKPLPRSRKRIARRLRPRVKGKPRFKVNGQPDEAFREWVRRQPCLVQTFECRGPIVVAHVRARGAGGPDRGNVVPLCDYHHFRQHMTGIKTWAAHHGLDLQAKAAETWAHYQVQRAGVTSEGP